MSGMSNRTACASGKPNIFDDDSDFGCCLIEAGAFFQLDSPGILLDKDPSSFKQKLSKLLKIHLDYPAIIVDAVQSISRHFEDEKIIRAFLAPVLIKNKENTTSFGFIGLNDSFLKILLNIDVLQHKLMLMLLDKIVAFCKKNSGSNSLCLSIIKQFCWLDVISEPEELVEKLFESVKSCPLEVRRGIILSLPEIADDRQHSLIARSLIDLMTFEPSLLLTAIDALDNLNLPNECLQEIKQSVIDLLGSAEIEELPVALKFLFHHSCNDDALQIVQRIRKNIKLSCDLSARPASTPMKNAIKKKEINKGAFALVVDALRFVPFHKNISNAWLKAIEDLKDTEEFQDLDAFVLLILHSNQDTKSRSENVLRNKIACEVVTSDNMKEVFSTRPEIMEDFFKSLMQLAELFLRSSYRIVVKFACHLYKFSFANLSSYCQQEIMGNLVTHIGSGCSLEVDLTIDLLVDLSENYLDEMMPYAAFINGILDYVDNLDLIQVKKVYKILGRLAFFSPYGSDLQDGLHIMITKQLSSHIPRYRQIGVIGGIMATMNISLASRRDESDTSCYTNRSGNANIVDDKTQQIKNMLDLIQSHAKKSPKLLALFFEELVMLVKKRCLDGNVEKWITKKVEEDFQSDFVADVQDGKLSSEDSCLPGEMPWMIHFNLDPLLPEEEDIVIDVVSLVAREMTLSSTSGRSMWCLSSCFRLFHTGQTIIKNGNLEDIDALLGCGIKVPKCFPIASGQLESSSKKETVVRLHSAFAIVNWFREVLNAFSNEANEQLREKVVSRLHSIVALQFLIERMLLECPDYPTPPGIYSLDPDSTRNCLVLLPKKSKTIKASGKSNCTKPGQGKKRTRNGKSKETPNDVSDESIGFDSIEGTANVSKQRSSSTSSLIKAKACINQPLLDTCYRELDMDVFKILSFTKLNATKPGDQNLDEFLDIKLGIDSNALVFLLEDLYKKLCHSLPKNSETRVFLKSKNDFKNVGYANLIMKGPFDVGKQFCDLIPHLCRYLEYLSIYFQASEDQNRTYENCFDLEEKRSFSKCLCLLIQVFVAFFSWSDLQTNKKLLKTSVMHIASRWTATTSSKLALENFKQAFNYLEKFGKIINDVSCAIHLCRLLSCLSSLSSCDELKARTANVSLNFLKRKWEEEEKKTDFIMAITMLLNTCFKNTFNILELIKEFISSAIPEFLQSEECSATFPTLNKDSVAVYYKLILFNLIEFVKTLAPGTVRTTQDENVEKMLDWNASVKIFRVLIDLIKTFDSRVNLNSALKYGRKFVDLFMRQCIPTLDLLLITHKDDVQNVFKTLQLSTRSLHHLCSHSKIKKDISLTNQVPQLKCTLESFIRRVKDMMNRNRCVAALWQGNLKNRNLKGEEILSQTAPSSQSEEDDDSNDEKTVKNATGLEDDNDDDRMSMDEDL